MLLYMNMMENNTSANKKNEFLPCLIIISTFCFLLCQTWFRWGDLIIDTGRELWLPAELLKGKILYKDIVSFHGLLPPYLIAGLYKLFGVSVNTLIYTGIAITLIVSFTVYRIARFFLDQAFSTLIVLNFLFVCAFGCYIRCAIFNFILPYAFASTFFTMFTVLSIYFFLKFIFAGKKKNILIWALFLTAALLCRLESALAVWPAFGLSGLILAVRQQKVERCKLLAYLFLPLIITALCYGVFFLITHTFHDFCESSIMAIKATADTPMGKKGLGLDDVPSSLSQISLSFLLHIAVFFALAMLCRIVNKFQNGDKTFAQTIIPLLAAFLFFMALKQSFLLYEIQFRCLTLVLLCGTIAYFLQAVGRIPTNRSLGLFVLFAASSLITCRIFFAPSVHRYGFFLLTLPLLCYYCFFGDMLKNMLEVRFKIPFGPLHTAIACFFILMIIPYWETSNIVYARYSEFISTSKGDFRYSNYVQNNMFWKTIDYLKKNTPKSSTVVVFPEGVGINFFTERTMPLRYCNFIPPDIKLFGEDRMLAEMKAAKIDYIVILTRDTSDFGPTSFGVDYAKKIQKWIDDNYVPVKQFGAKPYASNAMGMLILKRKIIK